MQVEQGICSYIFLHKLLPCLMIFQHFFKLKLCNIQAENRLFKNEMLAWSIYGYLVAFCYHIWLPPHLFTTSYYKVIIETIEDGCSMFLTYYMMCFMDNDDLDLYMYTCNSVDLKTKESLLASPLSCHL